MPLKHVLRLLALLLVGASTSVFVTTVSVSGPADAQEPCPKGESIIAWTDADGDLTADRSEVACYLFPENRVRVLCGLADPVTELCLVAVQSGDQSVLEIGACWDGTGAACRAFAVTGDPNHTILGFRGGDCWVRIDGTRFFPDPNCNGAADDGPPVRRLATGSITSVSTGPPAEASSVLVNLSMVDGAAPGYVTADQCTALVPGPQTKANGNHGVTDAIGNLSVVPIDPDGRFCIFNQSPVNLIADAQGFFARPAAGGQAFVSVPPSRKLDTRIAPAKTPAAGSITKVPTGVPAGTTAVLVNLAMTDGAAPGYIAADKCSTLTAGPQTKSNGNHIAGTAIGNLSVVPVDADGTFCIFNQQSVNLIVDLQGYFTPASADGLLFTPQAPVRRLDTRVAPLTIPAAGSITKVSTGIAAGAAAVLVNIAMVDGAAPGYVTADKCSALKAGPQTKANGNHVVGAAIGNLSVVPVDADGTFCIFNQQRVNLIVDVQGSFSTTGTEQFFPIPPKRVLDTRL